MIVSTMKPMKTVLLTKTHIESIPIHDADLVSVELQPIPTFNARLALTIKLHSDESHEMLTTLGVRGDTFVARFERCWRLMLDLLCHQADEHTIADWIIVPDSPFLARLKREGMGPSGNVLHHRFDFSSGSVIEVVSERVSIGPAS